jgi:hypothetical protein
VGHAADVPASGSTAHSYNHPFVLLNYVLAAAPNTSFVPVPAHTGFAGYWENDFDRTTPFPQVSSHCQSALQCYILHFTVYMCGSYTCARSQLWNAATTAQVRCTAVLLNSMLAAVRLCTAFY